jgi:predicted lipoprotein with Yx(FWY)xxD motif
MRTRIVSLAAASLAVLAGTAGCTKAPAAEQGTRGGSAPAAAGSATVPVQVQVEQSGLGPILTDQNGRTLYAFTHDKDGTSSCTGQCIATWPALAGRQPATAGTGIDGSLLSQTTQAEGTAQATYNNWPLYYYVGDSGPGDVDGQSVDGVWFVLRPNGTLVQTNP